MYRVGERVAKPGEGPFSRFMFTEQVSKAQVIYRLGGAASRTTAPSAGLRTSMARRSAFSNSLALSEASTGAAGYWGLSTLRRGRLRAERASRGLASTLSLNKALWSLAEGFVRANSKAVGVEPAVLTA